MVSLPYTLCIYIEYTLYTGEIHGVYTWNILSML